MAPLSNGAQGETAVACSACSSVRFVERRVFDGGDQLELVTELACALCGARAGLLAC